MLWLKYRLAQWLAQPSRYVGVYYEPKTKAVRKIVDTQVDWQLADPSHFENGDERLKLLRIRREHSGELGIGDCARIQAKAERILSKS